MSNAISTCNRETFFRSRSWRVFKRHKLALVGSVILSVLLFLSLLAPLLTPFSPDDVNLDMIYSPPSKHHLLGTDRVGRDVLTRLIYGTRVSLVVGLGGASVAAIIGVVLGSISGFSSGMIDRSLLKFSEIIICFPPIVIILLMVAIVGPSLLNIILIFGLIQWVSMYRMVRTLFLSLREQEFVDALRAFGVSKISIMFRHMLPNAVAPITVWITLTSAWMILQEAALSFLGLGVPTGIPSWGNMLFAAQELTVLKHRPWIWIPPGLVVSLAVLSINFLGDGLRDALSPRK